jgi:hypothetical protein
VAAAEVTDDLSGVFTPSMRAGRSRLRSRSKGFTRPRHTLAMSDAALSAHFNLQDRLAQIFVVNHRDIPELKPPSLVRPKWGVDGE